MTGGAEVAVVGSANLDLVAAVGELPGPGQTVLGADVVWRPGGKGANQAVAARRLGARTLLVAAVGDDEFGATLRAALDAERLDLAVAGVDAPTGIAMVVVAAGGENMITVSGGANRLLAEDHLAALTGRLDARSVLLLQLEVPVATCVAAARTAHRAGARVVVNAAPLSTDAGLADLLALTDVLIVNESEALGLDRAGSGPQARPEGPAGPEGWQALAERLRGRGPGAVVITLGGAGAVAAEARARHAVPAFAVEVVDTTGAGDAFCGAVAAALAGGRDLPDAVRRGCAAGALATTALGAQAALPDTGQVERLLAGPDGGRS